MIAPIVLAFEHLHDIGFTWNCNENIVSTKVFLCFLACDSVARAPLQNLKQFNGKFGCGFCLCLGEVVKKGHGRVRVYVQSANNPCERTHGMIKHAEMLLEKKDCVFGVNVASMYLYLILYVFFPDYMHAVLLGVVRQFVLL